MQQKVGWLNNKQIEGRPLQAGTLITVGLQSTRGESHCGNGIFRCTALFPFLFM